MSTVSIISRLRSLGLLAFVVLALAGCASAWTAKVTSFQHWPNDVIGKAYYLAPTPQQQGNLEFQTLADAVRANIGGPTGLVETSQRDAAQFIVTLAYNVDQKQGWAQRFSDPYYDPLRFGWGGFYSYPFGPWSGAYYAPHLVSVPVDYNEYKLQVVIQDVAQDNAEVYRSVAVTDDDGGDPATTMANLARALFADFPGNNGQEKQVKIKHTR